MPSTPAVTVIVPTYNAQAFVVETLMSVLGQTLGDLELIVVDDGSTDGTLDLVRALPDARVRLVPQANAGRCVARNHGLSLARAPLVCFLDHDDVWHPDKLAAQVHVMEREPDTALVHTDYLVWPPGPDGRYPAAEATLPASPDETVDREVSGWVYHHLLVDSFILTSTAIMRTAAVREVGGFDPDLPYSEDWDLWLRLSRRWQFTKLRGRYALYRQLPSQGSRVYRNVDYRMRLLEQAVSKWGIDSPNGQTHGPRAVRRQFGRFHAGYALECLRAGDRAGARRSLLKALRCHPLRAKYLAYLAAGQFGWRPPW